MRVFVVYGWDELDDFRTIYGVYTDGETASKVVDALCAATPTGYVIDMDEVILNEEPDLGKNSKITINLDGSVELRRVF